MNELSKIEIVPVLASDKDAITRMVDQYIEKIAFEGGDVLKDWAACEKLIFMLTEIQKGLKPFVITETHKHDKSEAMQMGVLVKAVASPAKYDYSQNEAWLSQKKVVDEATKRLKDTETFIKTLQGKMTVVDEETGEATEYFPPAKTSSETIRSVIN
jgi:hypothetical protein